MRGRAVDKAGQLAYALNSLLWRVAVPLWRSVKFLAAEHTPVRLDVVVIGGLAVWRVDADDEHAAIHGTVAVRLRFPSLVRKGRNDNREENGAVMVKLVESVVAVRRAAVDGGLAQ